MPYLPRSPSALLGRALSVLVLLACGLACATDRGNSAAHPAPVSELFGNWILIDLPSAPGVSPAVFERPASLTLSAEGAVLGNTGINQYRGDLDLAALEQGVFRPGPLITTRMAGSPLAMALEGVFLKALDEADGVRLDGELLVLTRAGEPSVRLRREH
jgi:heat shock protein HslJ